MHAPTRLLVLLELHFKGEDPLANSPPVWKNYYCYCHTPVVHLATWTMVVMMTHAVPAA